MTNQNCGYKLDCVALSIFLSIIVTITAAILRYTAIITLTPVFLWVALGVAVGFLFAAFLKPGNCCINACKKIPLWLLIIGSGIVIVTAAILLSVTFAATSLIGAIISGLLIGGLTLMGSSIICHIIRAEDCCN